MAPGGPEVREELRPWREWGSGGVCYQKWGGLLSGSYFDVFCLGISCMSFDECILRVFCVYSDIHTKYTQNTRIIQKYCCFVCMDVNTYKYD